MGGWTDMRISDVLQQKYGQIIQTGEGPYQANREALKALDILQDGEVGQRDVARVLSGMDALLAEIAGLKDAAAKGRNRAIALLRKA
jgi:hypothetical protein